MKLDLAEKPLNVDTSDDFKEMEFGIKACDVGFIMQLLRNDMYKYPIDAICREVASNSRDANREVGKGDIPIKITVSKNPYLESERAICFFDEGPGISPDRMQDVFMNYGASTKRDTDEQTGGFGLGAKTPFAYTNTFCIETVYKCKKYIYVAVVKKGNRGRMILLDESDCFDGSGTAVSVPIEEDDISSFEHAAYRATYFWDVRPIYRNFTTLREVNDYERVLETDKFIVACELKKDKKINFVKNSSVAVLFDGIPYEVDSVVDGVRSMNSLLSNLPNNSSAIVFLKLKTGEITISPNREALQYNKETIKRLGESLTEVSTLLGESSYELLERTNTLIERHLIVDFISKSSYYGMTIDSVKEFRPYNKYTFSELVKMYMGVRFEDIIQSRIASRDRDRVAIPKDNRLIEFNGQKLGQSFSLYFPGLRLTRVTFQHTDRTKSGILCKTSAAALDKGF